MENVSEYIQKTGDIALGIITILGFISACGIGALTIVMIFWRGPSDADRIFGDAHLNPGDE